MIKIDENDPIGEIDPSFPFREVSIKRNTDMKQYYSLQNEIGRGKFGTVYRCTEISTGLKLAAKFVSVSSRRDRKNAEREVEIMKELQHPRLIQLYDAFELNNVMCVVLELIEGGELFERVIDDDFILTEKSVSVFMRQICEGIAFIHSKNILHLDMKPENILCLSRTGNRIKIIDFGLARKFDPAQKLQVLFGTPEFVAPEVVNFDAIGFATDMWSVGVICYVLLSGLSPFMGESEVQTMANVTIAQYDFDDEAFDDISDDAKDFIRKLLLKTKEARLSATECLAHRWLQRPKPVTPKPSVELDFQKDTLKDIADRWNNETNVVPVATPDVSNTDVQMDLIVNCKSSEQTAPVTSNKSSHDNGKHLTNIQITTNNPSADNSPSPIPKKQPKFENILLPISDDEMPLVVQLREEINSVVQMETDSMDTKLDRQRMENDGLKVDDSMVINSKVSPGSEIVEKSDSSIEYGNKENPVVVQATESKIYSVTSKNKSLCSNTDLDEGKELKVNSLTFPAATKSRTPSPKIKIIKESTTRKEYDSTQSLEPTKNKSQSPNKGNDDEGIKQFIEVSKSVSSTSIFKRKKEQNHEEISTLTDSSVIGSKEPLSFQLNTKTDKKSKNFEKQVDKKSLIIPTDLVSNAELSISRSPSPKSQKLLLDYKPDGSVDSNLPKSRSASPKSKLASPKRRLDRIEPANSPSLIVANASNIQNRVDLSMCPDSSQKIEKLFETQSEESTCITKNSGVSKLQSNQCQTLDIKITNLDTNNNEKPLISNTETNKKCESKFITEIQKNEPVGCDSKTNISSREVENNLARKNHPGRCDVKVVNSVHDSDDTETITKLQTKQSQVHETSSVDPQEIPKNEPIKTAVSGNVVCKAGKVKDELGSLKSSFKVDDEQVGNLDSCAGKNEVLSKSAKDLCKRNEVNSTNSTNSNFGNDKARCVDKNDQKNVNSGSKLNTHGVEKTSQILITQNKATEMDNQKENFRTKAEENTIHINLVKKKLSNECLTKDQNDNVKSMDLNTMNILVDEFQNKTSSMLPHESKGNTTSTDLQTENKFKKVICRTSENNIKADNSPSTKQISVSKECKKSEDSDSYSDIRDTDRKFMKLDEKKSSHIVQDSLSKRSELVNEINPSVTTETGFLQDQVDRICCAKVGQLDSDLLSDTDHLLKSRSIKGSNDRTSRIVADEIKQNSSKSVSESVEERLSTATEGRLSYDDVMSLKDLTSFTSSDFGYQPVSFDALNSLVDGTTSDSSSSVKVEILDESYSVVKKKNMIIKKITRKNSFDAVGDWSSNMTDKFEFMDETRQRRISDVSSLLNFHQALLSDTFKSIVLPDSSPTLSRRSKFRMTYNNRDVPYRSRADLEPGVSLSGYHSQFHSGPSSPKAENFVPPSFTRKLFQRFFNDSLKHRIFPHASSSEQRDDGLHQS